MKRYYIVIPNYYHEKNGFIYTDYAGCPGIGLSKQWLKTFDSFDEAKTWWSTMCEDIKYLYGKQTASTAEIYCDKTITTSHGRIDD